MRFNRRSFFSGISLSAVPFLHAFGSGQPRIRADADWLKARALRDGDLIRFVAPAGPADRERVESCRKRIEALGFRVQVPQDLFRRDRYLGGTDNERAAELNAAIRDPNVRAVFPVTGGYGLMRILDMIDYEALRKDPKIVTGYSDLTALHLAISWQSRVITFHSPMPQSALFQDDESHAYAWSCFWKMIRGEGFNGDGRNGRDVELPLGRTAPERVVGGRATGRLVGGNLTLICSTLGTKYKVQSDKTILLIEDTHEAPYRVDRMFAQLRLAGILEQISGILIGTFDDTDERATYDVIRQYCSKLRIPVLLNYPVGHTAYNTTLPLGAMVELDADAVKVRLLENPVRLE